MENLRASWEAAYSLFWSKFDNCFTYAKTAVRARDYVRGLMSGIERKNGWQLAEYIGDEAPYAVQNFLSRAMWDAGGRAMCFHDCGIDHCGRTLFYPCS